MSRFRAAAAVLAALVLVGGLLAASAAAQTATPYLPAKSAYRILVFGDSLAAGLGSGLARVVETDTRFVIDGRYKEESGLARIGAYDWSAAIPRLLETNPFDIAVVMIGANDTREIVDGGLRHVPGSPDWIAIYGARVDGLIAALQTRKVAVYWVGLPPMEGKEYDAGIARIAAIQKERAAARGVRYVELRLRLLSPAGGYADRGADETGVERRLRSRDGIHFLKPGNNRVGAMALAAIEADLAAAPTPAGPVFGQDGKGDLAIAGAPLPAPTTAPSLSGAIDYPPGSAAERLYVDGIAPDPRPGRFDDFSMPAK